MAHQMTPFDPLADLTRFPALSGIDDLWRDLRGRYNLLAGADESPMRIDVEEDDKAYTIRADIPGVSKEDISVDIAGNRVSILAETRREKDEKNGGRIVRSERYVGQQYRAFTLEQAVDDQAAVAKYDAGVLHLTLPKKAGSNAKKLQIN